MKPYIHQSTGAFFFPFVFILSFGLLSAVPMLGQTIPSHRLTQWDQPGSAVAFETTNQLLITDFGADPTGQLPCDASLAMAIQMLSGAGKILFPEGVFLFHKTIGLPDSIILEGTTDPLSGALLTTLLLEPGENRDGILIQGNEISTGYAPLNELIQGERNIVVENPDYFFSGDVLRLFAFDDSLLVNNNWAYHSTGQIVTIEAIVEDTLFLDRPLRRSYDKFLPPQIRKINPRHQVHLRCLAIERMDATTAQTANISFVFARDASVTGVSSRNCNFAHVDLRFSSRITIAYSFFTEAFNYGGGGKAYGVMAQSGTAECLVHANVFKRLRHSMILQSGANGNVFAYNYSEEPYWTGTFLPSNSAGDLVLHGNYPYMNLFEGNVVQNIVIDNSHDINGPYNTFFRNRAELYGLFMNTGPASDQQNFIGNQISNTSSPLLGLYVLQGADHFVFGNMVKGLIMPSGSQEPDSLSLFGYDFGSYYQQVGHIPPIQHLDWENTFPKIEAQYRFLTDTMKGATCGEPYYEPVSLHLPEPETGLRLFPNPCTDWLEVKQKSGSAGVKRYHIFNLLGQPISSGQLEKEGSTIYTGPFPPGAYIFQTEDGQSILFQVE